MNIQVGGEKTQKCMLSIATAKECCSFIPLKFHRVQIFTYATSPDPPSCARVWNWD